VVPWDETGDPTGFGEPSGLGLGRPPAIPFPVCALLRLPMIAIAVPIPAISKTRTTTALMIIISGRRCTGAGAGPARGT
jgi:hypothetical protein